MVVTSKEMYQFSDKILVHVETIISLNTSRMKKLVSIFSSDGNKGWYYNTISIVNTYLKTNKRLPENFGFFGLSELGELSYEIESDLYDEAQFKERLLDLLLMVELEDGVYLSRI